MSTVRFDKKTGSITLSCGVQHILIYCSVIFVNENENGEKCEINEN